MYEIDQYLRPKAKPHIWCPGCGNGTVMMALLLAIKESGWKQEDIAVISGIGCSSHMSGFVKFNTINTLHGRPLTFATGVKLANPKLHVFVVAGDGDTTAIGGNHFIHACRRNIDITMIVINNTIYGMTGGQYSPMTPHGKKATTSVYGNLETPFDFPALAIGAGASYVARGTAYHTVMLKNLILEGMKNPGFSVIEAVAQCPTAYGRRNSLRTPVEMLNWQRDHAITAERAKSCTEEELADKFIIGKLHEAPRPEYTATYQELIDRLQEAK